MDDLFRQLLEKIGEDPTRPGLERTPERCSELWQDFTQGYRQTVEEIVEGALLPAGDEKTIVVRSLEFCSLCEHHLLPFYGSINICYRPSRSVLGFGTIHKLVHMFSRRLQIQEMLGDNIAQALAQSTGAQAVGVGIQAVHLCLIARNPAAVRSSITTFHYRGLFDSDAPARHECERLLSF